MRYFLLILAILLAPQAKAADVFDSSVSLGGSSIDSYYDDGSLNTWIYPNSDQVLVGTSSTDRSQTFVLDGDAQLGSDEVNIGQASVVDIVAEGFDYGLGVHRFSGSVPAAIGPVILQTAGRGTPASPAATGSGDLMGGFLVGGVNDVPALTGSYGNGIAVHASQNWTTSAQGTNLRVYTTQDGATTATERIRVADSGEVGIGTSDPDSLLHVLFGTSLGVNQPSGTLFTVESNSVDPYIHILGANGGGIAVGDGSDFEYYNIDFDTSSGEMTWTRDSELYLTWNSGVFELNSAASDVNFNVRGDTDNNLLFTDAGDDVVIFGSGTALAGCKVQFEDNACILDTATVSTTDATQTTLQTVAIPTDTAVYLNTKILARRTGGTSGTAGDSAVYEYSGRIKDVGGTVTIPTLVPQADFVSEDQDWSIIWAVDGTSIDIDVIGAADNDITWEVTTYYQEL